jgi:hypothetical protein
VFESYVNTVLFYKKQAFYFKTGLPDGLFSNQKSQIWVNFRGPLNGKCWYILWPLEYFMAIWYNF